MTDSDMDGEKWHLDRRIPIAFLAAILAQTFVAAWFISSLDSRVTKNTEASMTQGERLLKVEDRQRNAETGAARLDERLINMQNQLTRMERTLESLAREDRQWPDRSR